MTSGRSQPVCRPAWLAGLLVLLLATTLSAGAPSAPPLTIMPFQTATFVRDPVAAAELSEFSEFSARLLYWTDTPRDPIALAGRYSSRRSCRLSMSGAAPVRRGRRRAVWCEPE